MDVIVSGASGLIGKALVKELAQAGHQPRVLVRRPIRADHEWQWNPETGTLDPKVFDGVGAVINLNGAGIGDKRWTESYKQLLLDSRVKSTHLLATTMAGLEQKPSVFLSGSAAGFYGNRGNEVLTEESSAGTTFLADVVKQWEAAAAPAEDAGIRTVFLRTGVVYSSKGGALRKLLPLFRLGLGGKFGDGSQYQSWITLPDAIKAILFLLEADVAGPVNIVTPNPMTSAQQAKVLGKVLRRPALLPVPRFGPSLLLGSELTQALLFDSCRMLPKVLDDADGFRFDHPDFEVGLRAVLNKN